MDKESLPLPSALPFCSSEPIQSKWSLRRRPARQGEQYTMDWLHIVLKTGVEIKRLVDGGAQPISCELTWIGIDVIRTSSRCRPRNPGSFKITFIPFLPFSLGSLYIGQDFCCKSPSCQTLT
jgi:hypothetical protein